MEQDGLVGDLSLIKDSPVYILSGEFDTTVPKVLQNATNVFYENY